MASIAMLAVAWIRTSKISGEAFLVLKGHAVTVPGGHIDVYKVTKSQAHDFVARQGNLTVEHYLKATEAVRLALPNHAISPEEYEQLVHDANEEAQMKLCTELYKLQSNLGGKNFYDTTNTDRDGRFSIHVSPGDYLVALRGDAGKQHAEWYRLVTVRWQEELRLVEPTCSYEQ